jgi:hypothetical protein
LEFTTQSLEPPPLLLPLPLSSAPRQRRSRSSCRAARGLPLPLLATTRRPELARRLSLSPLALPEHSTSLGRSPELPPSLPPQLIVAAALPVPLSTLVAPTHHLQASHRPSFPLLASFRARHAAQSLPELRLAATPRRRPPAAATTHRALF